MIDMTIGKYKLYCSGNADMGMYGVYIYKEGKLIIHQSWAGEPTEAQAKFILEKLNGAEK